MNDNLEVVIGLEMHCELKSNSKVFSRGKNSYSDIANTNVSPVDMAFPGTLPVVNQKCVEHAIKMAKILHCKIADEMIFDRKNYYYPDLPKGYQITQCTKPVGVGGYLDFEVDGYIKRVRIHDVHLEEDAASLDHLFDTSTIDYNRCGVPLIECVTEPDFTSAKEAVCFLEAMRNIYRYTGISDADTKKGQIRCDVNVNLRNAKKEFVTPRVEMKNVNSFSNVYDSIIYEEKRQKEALNNNQTNLLIQETRRYDEESKTTIRMRDKVDAIDYKYFVDPNIPPYKITEELLSKIEQEIPMLPLARKEKYIKEFGLSEYDATVLIKEKSIADYFEECVRLGIDKKQAANWVCVNIIGELNKENIEIDDFYLRPIHLKQITDKISDGAISSKQAKEIFIKAVNEKKEPKTFISLDTLQISNEEELQNIIKDIIAENLDKKDAYLNGKTNLFDYFVGQVMKITKGKANPVKTKEILKEELEK